MKKKKEIGEKWAIVKILKQICEDFYSLIYIDDRERILISIRNLIWNVKNEW